MRACRPVVPASPSMKTVGSAARGWAQSGGRARVRVFAHACAAQRSGCARGKQQRRTRPSGAPPRAWSGALLPAAVRRRGARSAGAASAAPRLGSAARCGIFAKQPRSAAPGLLAVRGTTGEGRGDGRAQIGQGLACGGSLVSLPLFHNFASFAFAAPSAPASQA